MAILIKWQNPFCTYRKYLLAKKCPQSNKCLLLSYTEHLPMLLSLYYMSLSKGHPLSNRHSA